MYIKDCALSPVSLFLMISFSPFLFELHDKSWIRQCARGEEQERMRGEKRTIPL
jgi:hypothetical protein